MKRFRFAAFCAALLAFTACDVVKQAEGLYNMTQCEYEYDSVTDLSLAGVNLSGELTPLQIARLLGVLGGGASELPMGFDLNLGISNPNSSAAQIGAMDYILEIDGIRFTSGSVSEGTRVDAQDSGVFPIRMDFDIAGLLTGDSSAAALNAVKNFVGIGTEPSQVTLQIKPSVNIGGYTIPVPVYIPVSFSFGGAAGK